MQGGDKKVTALSAKMLRERRRVLGGDFEEFEDNFLDEDFIKSASEAVKQSEEDLKIKRIQNQVDYFGCMIEPLNMKNEREDREIDEDGNYRFSWRKDKDNSDSWLNQLDDEQQGLKMYMKQKKEKGVFSGQDNDDEEYEEEEAQALRKKVKKNEVVSKFENVNILELLQQLSGILKKTEEEIEGVPSEEVTGATRMRILKERIEGNKKPVFAFKKNMRQKEKEEQERILKEWESKQLSAEQEKEFKDQLEDLIGLIEEIEFKLQKPAVCDWGLERVEKLIAEEIKKAAPQEMENEIQTGEDDLKLVPKELLDKLNDGTITEEEEEEIRRLVMMARLRNSKGNDGDSDSDEEFNNRPRIKFDSDDEEEEIETEIEVEKKQKNKKENDYSEGQAGRQLSRDTREPQIQQNEQKTQEGAQQLEQKVESQPVFKVPAPVKRTPQQGQGNKESTEDDLDMFG